MDDGDLSSEYYHLRSRVIYLEHTLAAQRLDPGLLEAADLSRGLVHDLGNGLNVLRARMTLVPGRRGVNLSAARRAMETAGTLCECLGLRIYALPELSPDLPIRPSPVNLPEWIGELLEKFRVWLGSEHAAARLEYRPQVERLVVGDYDRKLRLAIWELLLDAQESIAGAPDGGVIRVTVSKTEDGQARICVTDSAPERSGKRGSAPPFGANGMGLYVCRKIVEKHRGRLVIDTAPESGRSREILLPAGNPEPDWEDEAELSLAMEALSDRARALEAELARCCTDAPVDGLVERFAAWCVPIKKYLLRGLSLIRAEMQPLVGSPDRGAAATAMFALNKAAYLEAVTANLRVLNPGAALLREPVNLNRVARQAAGMLEWRARAVNVEVAHRPGRELPAVLADPLSLSAAFLNVIRNAIDAAGSRALHFPVGRQAHRGRVMIETGCDERQVYARICDNGPGIPLELRSRLYDFDYTSRNDRRYGLGLYVALRALESAGGSIEVGACPSYPTFVKLSLPVFPRAKDEGSAKDDRSAVPDDRE